MIGEIVLGNRGKKFKVIQEIARGGFGTVYLVEDDRGLPFAMKVLSPVSDPAVQLSFEQEISSTLNLVHENLLEVVDYGVYKGGKEEALFAVSEYCTSGDYAAVLKEYAKKSPGVGKIIEDIRQVLSGLSILHTRIIHRDLKPQNILVKDGTLKIGDFGLAKFVDQATRSYTFKGGGTPLYMAPEVWLGKRVTQATDLYSVGVIFFEALCGCPPFANPDLNVLRDEHVLKLAPRASSINKSTPGVVDGIIAKLLAKEPKERYESAGEALAAFEAISIQADPAIEEIAARARKQHDAIEEERLKALRVQRAKEDQEALNKYKQTELLDMCDDVIGQVNSLLQETKIVTADDGLDRQYVFARRVLRVHFFQPGELYWDPIVPGRMNALKKHHVVHGGFIEITENNEEREGWNFALFRPPDSVYGDWRIVETRISPLVARKVPYEPIATVAQLFADNLSCHLDHVMHVYVLKDKNLERDDILKILTLFIPKQQ